MQLVIPPLLCKKLANCHSCPYSKKKKKKWNKLKISEFYLPCQRTEAAGQTTTRKFRETGKSRVTAVTCLPAAKATRGIN